MYNAKSITMFTCYIRIYSSEKDTQNVQFQRSDNLQHYKR